MSRCIKVGLRLWNGKGAERTSALGDTGARRIESGHGVPGGAEWAFCQPPLRLLGDPVGESVRPPAGSRGERSAGLRAAGDRGEIKAVG